MRIHQDLDGPCISDNYGSDLEVFFPHGPRIGFFERCAFKRQALNTFNQHIGKAREEETHLIGNKSMATGTFRQQIELLLFDLVFHIATLTVKCVVQCMSMAFEIGGNKAH